MPRGPSEYDVLKLYEVGWKHYRLCLEFGPDMLRLSLYLVYTGPEAIRVLVVVLHTIVILMNSTTPTWTR